MINKLNSSSFYTDDFDFINYGLEHFSSLGISIIFAIYFLYSAKYRWSPQQRDKYVVTLAIIVLATQLFRVFVRLYLGNFDHTEDLPFHLCNMMPFFMVYVYITKKKFWYSIFFFWIMAGTFQALFTPTLTEYLPHYEAIRYWAVHAGLPILALYGYYINNWHLTYGDAIRSGIALNILALIMYPLNLLMGANYIYLNAKPPGTTLYSVLGPWPYYILSLQLVWLILFCGLVWVFEQITAYREKNCDC